MKLLSDVLAFISLGFLSVPAWHLNHYAALAAKLTLKNVRIADDVAAERHRQLLKKVQDLRDQWKPWKARCLQIGTVAGLLAGLLTAWVSLREAFAAVTPAH